MLIVIDYRGLAKTVTYSLVSGAVACIFPTEPEEVGHRLMKRLYCIRAEHIKDTIVIANDVKWPNGYWRNMFMEKWYQDRGLEPVVYKGNRSGQSWPFAATRSDLERLYATLLVEGAESIGATVVSEPGLEADDVWGILAKTYPGEVLGYSTDTDWAQLVSDRVRVKSIISGGFHPVKDIRVKWIGGDPGDNIPGCPKRLKSGALAKNNWGSAGATKLLLEPDWESQLDAEHLERNRILTTLPCPLWNLEQAEASLRAVAVTYAQSDRHFDKYGVSAQVRQVLKNGACREAWIEKLRSHLLAKA